MKLCNILFFSTAACNRCGTKHPLLFQNEKNCGFPQKEKPLPENSKNRRFNTCGPATRKEEKKMKKMFCNLVPIS